MSDATRGARFWLELESSRSSWIHPIHSTHHPELVLHGSMTSLHILAKILGTDSSFVLHHPSSTNPSNIGALDSTTTSLCHHLPPPHRRRLRLSINTLPQSSIHLVLVQFQTPPAFALGHHPTARHCTAFEIVVHLDPSISPRPGTNTASPRRSSRDSRALSHVVASPVAESTRDGYLLALEARGQGAPEGEVARELPTFYLVLQSRGCIIIIIAIIILRTLCLCPHSSM